jgi:hypothetical protein
MNFDKFRKRDKDDQERKTSMRELKALSYPKAAALLPSLRHLPRSLYGLDGVRRILPQDVRQQIFNIAGKGEIRTNEVADVTLMLMLLNGEFQLVGLNHNGRFCYASNNSSQARPTPESVALAHHMRVLEILRKRLLRYRRLDEISILLMGLAGALQFTGIDRNSDLRMKIVDGD